MKASERAVISRIAQEVKNKFEHERSGHDWWHSFRVWKNAQTIAKTETHIDHFVIELAALLHDIADWKDHGGDSSVGPSVARRLLKREQVSETVADQVAEIIQTLSFKGVGVSSRMRTKEGCIVQDADRLDAIGAIGIARVFTYGGAKGRLIYDPAKKFSTNKTKEDYLKNNATSINHFYEKLLLLKDLMNTKTGKRIAVKRHRYMEVFLKQFYAEWKGSR